MQAHQQLTMHLEIKSLAARQFEGHGAVFGNIDDGGDIIVPGAFAKSLAAHKAAGTMPLMFWMHQRDQVPGVWLDMAEDSIGLAVKGELVDTSLGRDVHMLLTKKAVRGLSIGFRTKRSDWRSDGIRLLQEVDVREISIASMQSNPLATIEEAKSARLSDAGEYVPSEREIEEVFRKMGCSKGIARTLVSRLLKGGAPSPEDDDDLGTLSAADRLFDLFAGESMRRF